MQTESDRPERMNATDALFWYLDLLPDLRSTIGALFILERPPAPDRLRADVERLVASIPRLHQRVVDTPLNLAPPEWIDDAGFDLDYHLRAMAVPEPATMADLLSALGPLFATPLDRNRPLWELYAAERLLDGRSAVFVKMHHCLMDGVGGTRLMEALLGAARDADTTPTARPPPDDFALAPTARIQRALAHDVRDLVSGSGEVLCMLGNAARHPLSAMGDIATAAQRVVGLSSEFTLPRAASPLHHHRSMSRRLATFDMSLAEIDAARVRLRATNNDVVLTVVSGALHRWHTSRGADVKELRVLVPVNLRGGAEDAAGNRLALIAVSLPVGEPSPVRRLRAIQERTGRMKADHRATLYPLVARLVLALPLAIAVRIGRQQTYRTNLVCTNVPGPRHTCYLGAQAIERIYAYAPMVGDHPLAIAVYSYRDTLHVGLDVDPLAMPDLPHFLDALAESYAEVMDLGGESEARIEAP